MKSLVFDTGPIISLITNNLMDVLAELKKKFKGEFIISEQVKWELIDRSLQTKKYKLEGMMISKYINENMLKPYSNFEVREKTNEILDLANSSFLIRGRPLILLHRPEVESVALAQYLKADACVVDERTMRLIVEDPLSLQKIFEKKLHTKVEVNYKKLKLLKSKLDVNIIRSSELMVVAYELGLMNQYLDGPLIKGNAKGELLEGLLWGLKLRGCSISEGEIYELMNMKNYK